MRRLNWGFSKAPSISGILGSPGLLPGEEQQLGNERHVGRAQTLLCLPRVLASPPQEGRFHQMSKLCLNSTPIHSADVGQGPTVCQAACLVLEGENPGSNLVNISCTLSTYYVLGPFAGRWDVMVNWTGNLILPEPLRLWWSPGKPNPPAAFLWEEQEKGPKSASSGTGLPRSECDLGKDGVLHLQGRLLQHERRVYLSSYW